MIIKRFEEQAQKFAEKDAVITVNKRLTYRELNRLANGAAREIKGTDLNGQIVALLFEHSADMIIGVIAALKAEKTYVPLDINYPEKRLTYMLKNSGSGLILTNNNNIALAERLVKNTGTPRGIKILNLDNITVDTHLSPGNPRGWSRIIRMFYIISGTGPSGFLSLPGTG